MSEAQVRAAFAAQAGHCERLGSPFTALLCRLLSERLGRTNALGRRVLDWPGEPEASGEALPLRLAGGLHALVRRGRLAALARLYPPGPLPAPDALWAEVETALAEAGDDLALWLDSAPQTNEVSRSALLMAGLAVATRETGLPVALLELGASAGLNLVLERYAYDLGGAALGDARSALRLVPPWSGGPPPAVAVRVADRRGVDLNPIAVADPAGRERLMAYVWPDQPERLARIAAAIAIAAADPPRLDRADAADWIEARLAEPAPAGVARIVQHSIAFQYFPETSRRRSAAAITAAGARATAEAPLGWLRFEYEPEAGTATLRLTLWPGGEDRLLARADPHVRQVTWLEAAS